MTTTLTRGTTTLTPLLLLGYGSSRGSRNIVHTILGRSDPDITLASARLRAGTLSFLVEDRAAAYRFEAFHAANGVITFNDTEVANVNMRYVTTDDVTVSIDTQTQLRWLVDVPYQQVL